jgi:ACR3 family arsenite efflux pump ArsB
VALIILGIASLYPILFGISFLLSRITKISYGDAMALAFSVTAKNHAITIGVATTAFSGTLAVLPAAVAPLVQLPIMLGILRLAPWISRRLPAAEMKEQKSA